MHMLLILLILCLRKPDGISRLFSIAYAFAGNGCLGLPAVLPPPEEEKDVKTAIGAARAKNARKAMLK